MLTQIEFQVLDDGRGVGPVNSLEDARREIEAARRETYELKKYIAEHFGRLNNPGALTITQATIGNVEANAQIDLNGNDLIIDADGDSYLHEVSDDVVALATGGSERVRVDASGNVGINVTPSAWTGATPKALQISNAALTYNSDNAQSYFCNNLYFDGSAWKYINAGQGGIFGITTQTTNGGFTWWSVATGTAGASATLIEQMLLTSTGLGIGGTPLEKLSVFSGNLNLPKTSGYGIKVDTASPTFPWHDMLGPISIRGIGASDPSYNVYQGSIRGYQFDANEEVYVEFHVPHDYVPGSDIYIHAHWSVKQTTTAGVATNAVTGGSVTWGFEVTYAKGHNQAAFAAPITTTVQQNASTTQYQHMIAEVQLSAASPSASQIDSDNLEVDGLILVRAYLSANNMTVSAGNVPAPFLHMVDIHYQSTNIGTKGKAPNFYT